MIVEDFVYASNQTASVDELFALYKKTMSRLGFDQVSLSLLNEHTHLRREAEVGLMHNYSDHWGKHYVDNRYADDDPVLRRAISSDAAFKWDQLTSEGTISDYQKSILQHGKESGLIDGIAVPLRSGRHSIAVASSASSVGGLGLRQHDLSIASLLAFQFYQQFSFLMRNQLHVGTLNLTVREHDILSWTAKGYTKVEIAGRLNISRHTVDYHVRNILQKTGARNITVAVLSAIRQGCLCL